MFHWELSWKPIICYYQYCIKARGNLLFAVIIHYKTYRQKIAIVGCNEHQHSLYFVDFNSCFELINNNVILCNVHIYITLEIIMTDILFTYIFLFLINSTVLYSLLLQLKSLLQHLGWKKWTIIFEKNVIPGILSRAINISRK